MAEERFSTRKSWKSTASLICATCTQYMYTKFVQSLYYKRLISWEFFYLPKFGLKTRGEYCTDIPAPQQLQPAPLANNAEGHIQDNASSGIHDGL